MEPINKNRKFRVEGGRYLKGEISIRGAKNAVTKQMVAALLAQGKTTLHNVPDIGDVQITRSILQALGCKTEYSPDTGKLSIDTEYLKTSHVPTEYSGMNRIPILMAGPLLKRFGEASIPLTGGCNIGPRPVDFHIEGLKKLGAQVEETKEGLRLFARELHGAKIELPYPSVGATENIMMAACLARGTTIIKNAAIEPEIVDLALMLQAMGSIIAQEVDRTWVIQGVEKMTTVVHNVIEDRIEAASFAVSAVATGGDVFIRGADPLHLQTFLNWLRRAGGQFEVKEEGIRFIGNGVKLRPVALETDVHPGFMTDWQQPMVILLTQAEGISIVHETVYENRFGYVETLNRMGAKIQLFKECLGGLNCRFRHLDHLHSSVISGKTRLEGADIIIPDLRAGFSYMVAAALATGVSTLSNVHYIERGYDHIVDKFRTLGVTVEIQD